MMKNNSYKSKKAGFTIIELMIATTVFSLVLLLCTFGLLQVARVYYKGVTESKVQEALRSITNEISRSIQFSGETIVPTPSTITKGVAYSFCVGNKRYSVVTDRQLVDGTPDTNLSQSYHALVVDTFSGCTNNNPQDLSQQNLSPTSRELLSPNMRIAKLEVLGNVDNLYQINLRIVYGDDELLNSTHDACATVRSGTQFCSASELNTVVQKRI